jgi:hypothetical protein
MDDVHSDAVVLCKDLLEIPQSANADVEKSLLRVTGVCKQNPESTSQTLISLNEPLIILQSDITFMHVTSFKCPFNVFKHSPEFKFHILIVLSDEQLTIVSSEL